MTAANDTFKSFDEMLEDANTPEKADLLRRSAWSQYLSDGTQASLERYKRCAEKLTLVEDRCPHGMFRSGAGSCPQCGGGAE